MYKMNVVIKPRHENDQILDMQRINQIDNHNIYEHTDKTKQLYFLWHLDTRMPPECD